MYICPESNLTFLAYVHKDIFILVSRDTHKLIDMCIGIVIDRYTNIHNIFEERNEYLLRSVMAVFRFLLPGF